MLSPTNAIPRGGTGATDDSFNSSFKPPMIQQAASYAPSYNGNNANYSSIALTANSFQIGGGMGPENSHSFDTAAQNLNSRAGPPSSFQNTATDWRLVGQDQRAGMMDLSANDHISETRSNNNQFEGYHSTTLDAKYMRDNSGCNFHYSRNSAPN